MTGSAVVQGSATEFRQSRYRPQMIPPTAERQKHLHIRKYAETGRNQDACNGGQTWLPC
jgi:hypothetical protein